MSLKKTWDDVQEDIKKEVGSTSYETWFTALQVQDKDSSTLLIETPDTFFKDWIVDHYGSCIEGILSSKSGIKVSLEFSVNSNMIQKASSDDVREIQEKYDEPVQKKCTLNVNYTFDNFVVGPSNRFAAAAGLAVAESPAKAYNPLFIYGEVGLGKTHLIQSITHKVQSMHPTAKVCYISSEQFTNELIDAIRHRSTHTFRQKYRNIDVLLIDDIQFIAGKESTQEEFFHTFNNLHINHKQIIITSDRPPKEIDKLEERLSSRFAWGLITDIQPPDFETRVAILKKKNESEPKKVPDDVIYFIAETIKTNIRELEGALIRVVAFSLLEDQPVTLDIAKVILKDMVKESSKIISVEMVQKAVCEMYRVTLSDLKAKKRHKKHCITSPIGNVFI